MTTSRLALVILLTTMTMIAAAPISASELEPRIEPEYFDLEQDGPVSMSAAPDGTMWAVWAYRNGLDYDVAVSQAVGQTWSLPLLLGQDNGYDDYEPRIVFLSDGSAYLVWSRRASEGSGEESVSISAIFAAYFDGSTWGSAWQVSDPGTSASSPAAYLIEDDSAIVGFVVDESGGPEFQTRPLSGAQPAPNGGTSSPDPMPTIPSTRRGHTNLTNDF